MATAAFPILDVVTVRTVSSSSSLASVVNDDGGGDDGQQQPLWKLGDRRNWARLAKLLAPFADAAVLSDADDDALRRLAARFDADADPLGDNAVFWLLDSGDNDALLAGLLELGVDADRVQSEAWRPSHNAAFWGRRRCLDALAKCRADLRAANQDGETPWDVALENNKMDVLPVIEEHLRRGPKSLAELCRDRDWFAVRNLTRRRKISPEIELREKVDGRTAIEWVARHQRLDIAAELRFRYKSELATAVHPAPLPSVSGDDDEPVDSGSRPDGAPDDVSGAGSRLSSPGVGIFAETFSQLDVSS